jgi:hypothetical protein
MIPVCIISLLPVVFTVQSRVWQAIAGVAVRVFK